MKYKALGNTGVRIPEIGLGTWQYAGDVNTLKRGVELGACLIDTAESYGTEELVGEAVRGIREQVFLATKVSRSHFKYKDVLKACELSLRRLGTDYIDLYQLHHPSREIPIYETMRAMETLVDSGKIRFIGVSNFSIDRLKNAQAALTRHRIVSNQILYNLANRLSELELLPYCYRQGLTVIAYSPLGTGIPNIKAKDRSGVLSRVATMTGRTDAQILLNWCISQENVVAIPKATSVEHVEDNCASSGWRLSQRQVKVLESCRAYRRRGRVEMAARNAAWRIRRRLPHSITRL